MTEQKIVVHYTRNSTHQQVMNNTHEVHLKIIRKYTETNNFKCIREFVDKGVSGTKKERKQLQAMRNFIKLKVEIKEEKIDYIIITKLDRIMRNWLEFNDLYKELLDYNVGLIAIEQSNLNLANWSNPQVKIFITFLGLAAELEAEWINERVKSGKKYAEVHGTKSGLPMHRPRKEFPEEKIIKEWSFKPSIQYLANKYNCSWQTMNKYLKELGLK